MEFGYARVSTSHQNTDRQIEALLEYGIPERNIIVDKQSGKDFERVGYLALKNTMLRAGDTLVIKELDRLGRNKQMIKEELEWLKAHEIRVKILNVPTSLMECDGQDWILEMVSNILIEVMASIAEEERLKNHQRQSEGIQAAKNRGVVFGRPTVRKPENYEAVMEKVASGDMKAVEAMREIAQLIDMKYPEGCEVILTYKEWFEVGVICDKKIFAKTLLKEKLRSRRLAIMLIDFMKDKSVRLSKINSTKNPDTRLLFDDLPSVADDVKRTFYLIIDIDETIRSERDIVDYCIYGGWINKEFVEVLGKEEALPIFEDLIPFILREEMILCG